MSDNFIPCVKWIKRGIAKSKPEVIKLTREELQGLTAKAKSEILEAAENLKKSNVEEKKSNVEENASNSEEAANNGDINMDDYDNEDDTQSLFGIGNMINIDEVLESNSNAEEEEDEDDSDKEDEEIKPTDNLVAVGHVYGDMSVLEVYVFNEEDDDFYVHHDIMLPTIPLALEWLSYTPSGSANLLALGGMTPEITIWDMDIANSLEPTMKLGEFSVKKKFQHRNHGHRDAVLDLSWNTNLPHVLASGSVDRSVILWDLAKAKPVTQFNDFNDKVQAVEWHPVEGNILLAGACDSTVRLFDCRTQENLLSLRVDGEVEKVAWHPGSQYNALVGTSKGVLCCADCRTGKVLWSVKAHSQEITGLIAREERPNRIVTTSTDETLKVWDLTEEPKLIFTKHSSHGQLHCLQACPENPDIVCVGGNKKDNNIKVYNLSSEMERNSNPEEMDDT